MQADPAYDCPLWDSYTHGISELDTQCVIVFLQVLGNYMRRRQDPNSFINEIKYIASDPDEKYFFNVTDEAALNDIVDALGDRIFSLEGENTPIYES